MKVIYCPTGVDPIQLARQAQAKRSGGGGGILAENWWIVLAVIAFVVIGVTVGPFKGLLSSPEKSTDTPVAVAAPVATPTPALCSNPAGGLVAAGDLLWIDHGTEVAQYRCENGNLLKVQTLTQTVSLAP